MSMENQIVRQGWIAFIVLSWGVSGFADEVVLKNGQVIDGKVTRYVPGDLIEIRADDGQFFRINASRVESVDIPVQAAPKDEAPSKEHVNEHGQEHGQEHGKAHGKEGSVEHHKVVEGYSERFHQAITGQFELTPALGYTSATVDALPGGTGSGSKLKGFEESLMLEYGLNSHFSFAVKLANQGFTRSYTQAGGATTSENKESGLENPSLFFHGRLPVGEGFFHYGAQYSMSLTEHNVKANADESAATGGSTVTPYLELERSIGPGILGGAVKYDLIKTKRTIKTDGVGTQEGNGGDEFALSGFYEVEFHPYLIGLALEYAWIKREFTDDESVNKHRRYGLEIYGTIEASPTIEVLPGFVYSIEDQFNADAPPAATKISSWAVNTAVRFKF